jgi:hypothetical protein
MKIDCYHICEEPPYLKTNLIKNSRECDILINSHEFLIFFKELGCLFQVLGKTKNGDSHKIK